MRRGEEVAKGHCRAAGLVLASMRISETRESSAASPNGKLLRDFLPQSLRAFARNLRSAENFALPHPAHTQNGADIAADPTIACAVCGQLAAASNLPDVPPGRCDADRASSSALGTGGASHRDARRIGPDRIRHEPLKAMPARGHWLSVRLPCSPCALRPSAKLQPLTGTLAPACGPVRRLD